MQCWWGGEGGDIVGDDEGDSGGDDEGPRRQIDNTTDARMMRGLSALSSGERKDL